ncbi:MAG: MFS transporter [Pirellulaceae bacterium]|nr:MFS transporter [Pirellulaceae bacterium]
MKPPPESSLRWYEGITRYQWLALLIASLGWIFDVFEGQIFVSSMQEAMPSLLPDDAPEGTAQYYNNIALALFLLGGALGGVLFGALSDRIGRTVTMILTILMYSLFTCVTAAAQTPWQMAFLRFLVAMGVGGEWAVAAAMVAEVFPERARARTSAIFHASSVFGTYLAIAAGVLVVGNPELGWRVGFALGALPAVLTLWIRWRLREPDKWVQARAAAGADRLKRTGNVFDLFGREYLGSTLIGVSLASVGLATFWGVHIYGKDLMRKSAQRESAARATDQPATGSVPAGNASAADAAAAIRPPESQESPESQDSPESPADGGRPATTASRTSGAPPPGFLQRLLDSFRNLDPLKQAEMLGMFLTTTGGGVGLLAFGPLCEWLGRRGAFLFYHLGGAIVAVVLFQWLAESEAWVYWLVLPVFGFLTLGMHAGYAVYFPELFPTRLRGSGAGFCFNVGRVIAAPIMFLAGWMQKSQGFSLEDTASLLSGLFLVGVLVLLLAPETKGRELPT